MEVALNFFALEPQVWFLVCVSFGSFEEEM